MQFSHKTILEFFDSSQRTLEIPVYQRAYSWEEPQWKIFIEDLKEQVKGDNNYFYGNLLLETIKKGVKYEVIDGQQRLTTLSIFIRAILTTLKEKEAQGESISINIGDKESLYLKSSGVIKLRPVEYDRACYDAVIIDGKDKFNTTSPSQERILDAKNYFVKELRKENAAMIERILEKIEGTEVTTIELAGKKDAALMFELQNNRGKDLTNMERLKAYFMYQMYVYSKPSETETNIENISNIFKSIYVQINDLKKLTEDSILIYHCNAYVNGYNYRTLEDIKSVFKSSSDKVKWIKDFIEELHTTFINMKKFENSNLEHLQKLNQLYIPAFVYPFVVKGYKHFGDDDVKLDQLFNLLELVVFRYHLTNSRADIISRLNSILLAFNGDVKALANSLLIKFNEEYHWSNTRVSDVLNGRMYGNSMLNYILWNYEDSLQNKGYSIGTCTIDSEQIEHISPQTPPDGQSLASGYEVNATNEYEETFIKESLNSLGNLMLISGSHNASIGNKPFVDKLNSYNSNPLLKQQAEIKSYASNVTGQIKWDKTAIEKRHKVIYDYCIKQWGFNRI